MFKMNFGSRASGMILACTGLFMGAVTAIVGVGLFQPLQQSIAWRSDRLMDRAPVSQLNLERTLLSYWRRAIALTPTSALVTLGDSHLNGLQGLAISPNIVNLSIGGLSAVRLNEYLSLGLFPLPLNPSGFLIHLGHNDLEEGLDHEKIQKSLDGILGRLGSDLPIVIMELFPRSKRMTNSAYDEGRSNLNFFLRRRCEIMPKCTWLPVEFLKTEMGDLDETYVERDGVHLNLQGYQKLLDELKVFVASHSNLSIKK
jgi:lysophospholipase L1-like esterase